ncbi:MAG TPA: ATP-dependent Clp protease adaptor ClpS [Opitutales bacterium]|nr:ATP-dependent Clp protease adaptor ClpS [Opitutales bacterium]
MNPPAQWPRLIPAAATSPHVAPRPRTRTEPAVEPSWDVIVLDDDVNLMTYVVHVFRRVFGYEAARARQLMLEVHQEGRSVVWTGAREAAEHYVHALHQWHLRAKMESHA